MAKSLAELRTDALRIMNETAPKQNTAERVGGLLVDIVDALANPTVQNLIVTGGIHFKPDGTNDTFAVTSAGVESNYGYKMNGRSDNQVLLAGGGTDTWSGSGGGGGGDDPDPGTGSTVYYGFAGSSISNVNSLQSMSNKSSAAGYYTSVNSVRGQYWWIVIPSSWNITAVKSEGFGVPMESPITITVSGSSYKAYRASNALVEDTYVYEIV